jgi:type IV pilus assembly protein PilM
MTQRLRQLLDHLSPRRWGASYHVGLQLSGERLNVAQMYQTASGTAFRAVASVDIECPWDALLAEPRRLKRVLKRVWAEHGFSGSDVVACMPHEQLKVFSVTYTAAEGQSETQAIAGEIRERLKGNLDAMVFDFVPVRQPNADDPVKEVVVAAASRGQVIAFLELLSAAGLTAMALDIGPMALRRVVPWAGKPAAAQTENALLINVGSSSSSLTVMWGRRLMLDRSIEFSEQRLLSRVKTVLDLPDETARRLLLTQGFVAAPAADGLGGFSAAVKEVLRAEFLLLKAEVTKTLNYAASRTRGRSVDKIFLVGSIARYPGILELISEALSRPVELLNPFAIFPHRLTATQLSELSFHSGVTVATGLALRGVPTLWQS